MNRSRMMALVAVFSLTCAGAAWGDVLNESCGSVGPSATDVVAGDISCGQFNVAGATLNSITITIDGADTGSITLTNTNATDDASASGTITSTYSLDSALSGFAFSAPLFQILMSIGPAPIAAGNSLSNTALSGANTAGPLTDSNGATFGTYTGGSFFDIFVDISSLAGEGVVPTANLAGTTDNSSDTVSATASVSFDYTPGSTGPAPEPGTALLLGLGTMFVVFGASRRRKA